MNRARVVVVTGELVAGILVLIVVASLVWLSWRTLTYGIVGETPVIALWAFLAGMVARTARAGQRAVLRVQSWHQAVLQRAEDRLS